MEYLQCTRAKLVAHDSTFYLAIAPFIMALESKVRCALKSSVSYQSDWH